jgi:phage host-nuclease inhibitor protein Gam
VHDDELKGLLEALSRKNDDAHVETRRLFHETADRIAAENQQFFAAAAEGLRHEIQLVAEGVTSTRETLARNIDLMRIETGAGR